jgi:hypothetical protein
MEEIMKAILEFNLPEEQSEFNMATRGHEFFCALWDLNNLLRDRQKYDISIDEFKSRFEEIIFDVNFDGID